MPPRTTDSTPERPDDDRVPSTDPEPGITGEREDGATSDAGLGPGADQRVAAVRRAADGGGGGGPCIWPGVPCCWRPR